MRVVAVHPDPKRLDELAASILAEHPDSEIKPFSDQMLAVKYGYNNPVDALYTFTRMRPLDGFGVARLLREQSPGLLINFIAESDSDWKDAMRFGMNSYTVEPVTLERLHMAETEEW